MLDSLVATIYFIKNRKQNSCTNVIFINFVIYLLQRDFQLCLGHWNKIIQCRPSCNF